MINGNTFINLGYEGSKIGECLVEAKRMKQEAEWLSDEELTCLVCQLVKKPAPLLEIGEQTFVAKAITPQNDAEQEHADKCEKGLLELTSIPVVKSASMMPDACPTGSEVANICVGGVIEVENAIIPSAHSADVCCSMHLTMFESELSTTELLANLKKVTRFGAGSRKKSGWVKSEGLNKLNESTDFNNEFLKDLEEMSKSYMADQGDGNHFAYIGEITLTKELFHKLVKNAVFPEGEVKMDVDSCNHVGKRLKCLVTHHGSRKIGAEIYKRGLKRAVRETDRIAKNIPKNGAWLDYNTKVGKDYWEALQYAGDWTKINHETIHANFIKKIKSHSILKSFNAHNFVWKKGNSFFHGKGATPAGSGKIGLIPLNMKAPILIVEGIGNDYLNFCPHGAGRDLSRTQFKSNNNITDKQSEKEFSEKATKGIEVVWYQGLPDASETPTAYKNADWIKSEIEKYKLANIIGEIQPLGSIMAGESPNPPAWKTKKKK